MCIVSGQPAPILPYSFFAKSSAKLLHFLNSTKLFCTPSKVLRCITSCISNIAVTSLAKFSKALAYIQCSVFQMLLLDAYKGHASCNAFATFAIL